MKKIKKILIAGLATACLGSAAGALAACGTDTPSLPVVKSGDLSLTLQPDGTYSVTAANKNLTKAKIPASYEGSPVTTIGERAFNECGSLESVTIPDSVITIESFAFYKCESLKEVDFGQGVTSIGCFSFSRCGNLTEVTLPDSVTTVKAWAFEDCAAIEEVTVSENLTSIEGEAFGECTALTTVYWNATDCKEAGDYVSDSALNGSIFRECPNLSTVIFGEGVRTVPAYFLKGIDTVTEITLPDSITSIGNAAFYNCAALTKITFSENLTSIGWGAFAYCNVLAEELELPEKITAIGDYAFAWCQSLPRISIGGNVTSIGKYTFHGCTSLAGIALGDAEGWNVCMLPRFDAAVSVEKDLSDEAVAATCFTSTYRNYYWKKS